MFTLTRLSQIMKCRATEESVILTAEQNQEAKDAIDLLAELFGSRDTKELLSKAKDLIARADKIRDLVDALEAANRAGGTAAAAQAQAGIVASLNATSRRAGKSSPLGEQLAAELATFNQNTARVASARANPALASTHDKLLKLRGEVGRNDTERAMSLLSREREGFSTLDRLDQVQIASAWLRGDD